MRIQLLDIGNSHTRCAVWDGVGVTSVRTVPTPEFSAMTLTAALPAAAACVVPEVRRRLETANCNVCFIDASHCSGLIDFSDGDYATLGADRVANAVALAHFYPLPGAVIDCGTAITFELVDSDRRFCGGAILPGRALMAKSLAFGTAALPRVELDTALRREPGRSTLDAMSFGIGCGAVGAVREILSAVSAAIDLRTVMLTGGDAGFFANALNLSAAPDDFTLQGIRLAAGDELP